MLLPLPRNWPPAHRPGPFGLEGHSGLRGTTDRLGAPISQNVHGASLHCLPALVAPARRSTSWRFRQIPLLVGRVSVLKSALQSTACLTYLERFGRESLNSTLSLQGGVA